MIKPIVKTEVAWLASNHTKLSNGRIVYNCLEVRFEKRIWLYGWDQNENGLGFLVMNQGKVVTFGESGGPFA